MAAVMLKATCSALDMEQMLGKYIDVDDTWVVASEGRYVREEDGSLIAHVKKRAISDELVRLGEECYMRAGKLVSTNRGVASGVRQRDRSYATFEKGPKVNSGIIGYIDNTNLRRPCRLTQFSKQHFYMYSRGLPFIRRIDECFMETIPDAHARQRAEALRTEYHIAGTAFSTVTVNYNFRTSVHKDSGDFRHGFGTLVVCQRGVRGGHLLFPRYKLAIALERGDFLAMDVHEYHCNSEIVVIEEGGYRLSFVCYLRERMSECDRVNERIRAMHRAGRNTDDWIRDIFGAFGEEVPEKAVIGRGAGGHEWWERRGEHICVQYKNKRYTLVHHATGMVVHELGPAWEFALTRCRSPKSDGSCQAR